MSKKYIRPQVTKLGSLYSITNQMAGGAYADATNMMIMA